MSVRETKEALIKLSEGEAAISTISSVYELRFIKLNLHLNSYTRNLWIYLGRESDYLIIPGIFCSCKDFIIRTVINKTSSYCKHQAGVYIALKKNKYLALDVTLEEAYSIVQEILSKGLSLTLRKKIK